MTKKQFKHGLTLSINGVEKTYTAFSVVPQTLRGELAALDYIETMDKPTSETAQNLMESLAYIAQQVVIKGIDVTAQVLIELTSDDYKIILDALENLEKKSATAGA